MVTGCGYVRSLAKIEKGRHGGACLCEPIGLEFSESISSDPELLRLGCALVALPSENKMAARSQWHGRKCFEIEINIKLFKSNCFKGL